MVKFGNARRVLFLVDRANLGRQALKEFQQYATPDDGLSPLETAIGVEAVESYETALQTLRDDDRQAIVGRLEMDYSYEELAVMLGKSSPGAARVAVSRALVRLAEAMGRGR